jgi:hypothetical protein
MQDIILNMLNNVESIDTGNECNSTLMVHFSLAGRKWVTTRAVYRRRCLISNPDDLIKIERLKPICGGKNTFIP